MAAFTFSKSHALKAIGLVENHGLDWLYQTYPKPNGKVRKSKTGFLMQGGVAYPVKPLGRLASEIAGKAMNDNPTTDEFRRHFEKLGFQLILSPEDDADSATDRQRRLAEVWERPGQAAFRRAVFKIFGARCLVTGCENLIALEAAHILSVKGGGSDETCNGIPLRADLHRLFDACAVSIEPDSWKLIVTETALQDYGQYHNLDLGPAITKTGLAAEIAAALRKRNSHSSP